MPFVIHVLLFVVVVLLTAKG